VANDPYKPKQLVDANLVTEFGGVEDMEQFKDEGPGYNSYTFVPGFSDMRYQRDLDLARLHRGEIKGKDVRTLDWNCRWFRTTKGAGSEPDNTRTVHAKADGYRPAMWDDIGKVPWLTEAPPGASKGPDGTIRISGGDLQLMVIDKAGAAKIAMRRKIRTEESVDGMEFATGGLGSVGKSVKGADPYVEKTIGTQAKGDSK
jgi:hypothetical protein